MSDFLKLLGKSFAIVFGSGVALLALGSIGGLLTLGAWHYFRHPSRHSQSDAASISTKQPSNNGSTLRLSTASTYEMQVPDGTTVTDIPASTPPAKIMHAYWRMYKPCPPKYPSCDASTGVPSVKAGNCDKDGCYLTSTDKGLLGWISRDELLKANRLSAK